MCCGGNLGEAVEILGENFPANDRLTRDPDPIFLFLSFFLSAAACCWMMLLDDAEDRQPLTS